MITILLDNYIVNIYTSEIYDTEKLRNELNDQEYPRGIIEKLSIYSNISRIDILSLNNEILLTNNLAIE